MPCPERVGYVTTRPADASSRLRPDCLPKSAITTTRIIDEGPSSEGGVGSITEAAETVEAHSSFEALYARDYERLCRATYLMMGDVGEAEDVTQEAFCRVLERWDKVSRMDSPGGYVFVTATNLARRRLRWRVKRMEPLVVPEGDHADSVVISNIVRQALDRLTRSDRRLLVLTDWLEVDVKTCARLLSLTEGATRVRTHRARKRFMELITEEDDG
jgi:RNA polymerase sigma-70 factor (ECF subfamily)